jgi:hypothetical protein
VSRNRPRPNEAARTLAAAPVLWFLARPERDPEGRSEIAWPLIAPSTLAWLAAVAFDVWSLESRP